ncbi:WecB/TagA/CpsF family glycosyltransferase [Stutzerimonas azotifigens]|uniref:WecB/TagA/CpsF family glycosyltransferase n=1 Tax=Stutzerimonas azotifigens TaxID=291995 RepID=UPI0004189C8F|nr:WecB/TagA/CpsF family glycosyltransferase [Stutzerimonas azotifigens]
MKKKSRGVDPLVEKMKLLERDEVEALLHELAQVERPTILGFLNQHGYNIAQRQPQTYRHFAQLDYLLRDGIGMKMACRMNGIAPRANLNGSDFIPRLTGWLLENDRERYQFFAMGTRDPWLSVGARALFKGQDCHRIDGFQEIDDYVRFVKEHQIPGKTAVVVLAMGMPKQEEVAIRLRQTLETPALLICGGAILDFAAGRFPRAPRLMQKAGLEWAFRLLMEPRRLFARYVMGIPIFFFYASTNALGMHPNASRGTYVHEPLPALASRPPAEPLEEEAETVPQP